MAQRDNRRIRVEALEFEEAPSQVKTGKITPTKIEIKPSVKPEKAKEETRKTLKIDEVTMTPSTEAYNININVPKETKEKPAEKPKTEEKKETPKHEEAVTFITTIADKILWSIQKEEKSVNELAKELNAPPEKIEELGLNMQDVKLVEVTYPKNVLLSPRIKSIKSLEAKKFIYSTGKTIKQYEFLADNVPTKIRILNTGQNTPVYEVIVPMIDYGTEAVMKIIANKVAEDVTVTSEELSDPRMMIILKSKFMNNSIDKITKKFPNINEQTKNIIAGFIIQRMYGLKYLELLMSDDNLEEITINGSENPIAVYHKEVGWCMTNLKVNDEEEVLNFASSIGRKVGKTISLLNPIMDAHLITGDRVEATLFPISSNGNTITIRKFARNPWTITQYINAKTLSSEIGAFMWLAMQYELSVMIAGGTASGKTSCLNSMTALIPPNQRIISIEDIREINLPKLMQWNWVPLTVRESRNEERSNISMLDLMVSSLRMRPDRIIVGEVRKKRQAEVLFEAIHTGHAVYTTIHSDNAEQAFIRLTEAPISIPMIELEGLQLIIVMFRDRRTGMRRLFQIAELVPIPGDIGERKINVNILYRWLPKNDKWEKLQDSERVINDIAMHTGMSEEDINQDLRDKKEILEWMVKHEVFNIDEFGKVLDAYYRNPKLVLNAARKNSNPGVLY